VLETLYRSLAGLGLRNPLHAPLAHLPIGLVFGAAIFILVALIFGKRQLVPTARHIAILAFILVFPTILAGVFDWMHYYHGILFPAIKAKMLLAGVLLLVLGTGVIVGGEAKLHVSWLAAIYVAALVCVLALGWLGGGIVYGRYAEAAMAAAAPPAAPAAAPSPAGEGPPSAPPPSAATARAAASAPTPAKTGKAQTGPDASKGRELFESNCMACHADGGNAIAASLPLKTSKKLASLADFTAFVRKPSMPDGSDGGMPPFAAEDLPDAGVADLYAYVRAQLAIWK
jgi:mono/diheme cytochrome c family protein/uncharacterized membrane protein